MSEMVEKKVAEAIGWEAWHHYHIDLGKNCQEALARAAIRVIDTALAEPPEGEEPEE